MRFLDAILRPVARLLVARGMLFAEAAERLKAAYVAAAVERSGARATDSRISVMTGLQRREVARLRGLPGDDGPPPGNPLARVVVAWLADPRYAGRDLPRNGTEGSFEALVRGLRRDVHPRSVLEELLATGTVSLAAGDMVRLEQASFQPLAGSAAQLDYLAANAGDFLTAAVANVLADRAPFFERAAHFNRLDNAAVQELEAMFRDRQMAVLREVAERAAELQGERPGNRRFRAGGYFFHGEDG